MYMFPAARAPRMVMTVMKTFGLFVFMHCSLLYKLMLQYTSSHKFNVLDNRQLYLG